MYNITVIYFNFIINYKALLIENSQLAVLTLLTF